MENYLIDINIALKKSILDPQGGVIEHALHALDMPSIFKVRTGKWIQMEISAASQDEAKKIAQSACDRLLVNPVIEFGQISVKV